MVFDSGKVYAFDKGANRVSAGTFIVSDLDGKTLILHHDDSFIYIRALQNTPSYFLTSGWLVFFSIMKNQFFQIHYVNIVNIRFFFIKHQNILLFSDD